MLTPQIKSQVKLFTNEGINENVFRQNGSEGQKISGSLFNVTENKLFGENKVKSNNSIFQSKEVREKNDMDNSKADLEKMRKPGRHVLSNGVIITNDEQGRNVKAEFNADDKDNRYTVEREYKDDGCSNYVETYKDNNNKVRYSEEHSEEHRNDKAGNLVTTEKTTVRDAKGNIVYIKTVKKVTSFEKVGESTYQSHRTIVEAKFQDANGKEISLEQAFEKRNKLRTPAMRENSRDNLEKLMMEED